MELLFNGGRSKGDDVTGIVANRFLGVPYTTVSAHSRHIHQGWRLDGAEERWASQHNAASAKD